jgi:hypothetical protein
MAVSFVQITNGGFASPQSSLAVSFNSGTLARSIIVVAGLIQFNGKTVNLSDGHGDGVTDSGQGLVFDPNVGGSGSFSFVQAFFKPTAGTTTITATYGGPSSPSFGDLYLWEIAGYQNAAFDQVAQAQQTNVSSSSSGATGTLAQPVEAAMAYCAIQGSVTGVGGGWTFGQGSTVGSNAGDGIQATTADGGEHQVTSTTAPITGTFSTSAAASTITWAFSIKDVPPLDLISGDTYFRPQHRAGWF